jgi:hypothetical protein
VTQVRDEPEAIAAAFRLSLPRVVVLLVVACLAAACASDGTDVSTGGSDDASTTTVDSAACTAITSSDGTSGPTYCEGSGTSTTAGPRAEVGFSPVLATSPPPCTDDQRATLHGGGCYALGPGLTDAVESGVPGFSAQNEMWSISLTLTEQGIARFNDLAASCAELAATCPTGQIAIVVADVVYSAPTIQQPSFERDQIQITGNFTETEARQLAEAIAP